MISGTGWVFFVCYSWPGKAARNSILRWAFGVRESLLASTLNEICKAGACVQQYLASTSGEGAFVTGDTASNTDPAYIYCSFSCVSISQRIELRGNIILVGIWAFHRPLNEQRWHATWSVLSRLHSGYPSRYSILPMTPIAAQHHWHCFMLAPGGKTFVLARPRHPTRLRTRLCSPTLC